MSKLELNLTKLQAASGAAFGVFLFIHLCNNFLANLSQSQYDSTQLFLRKFYQHPIIETGIFLSLAVHFITTAIRITMRSFQTLVPVYPLPRIIHRSSGYFLAFVIAGHVFATRGATVIFGKPVDFSTVSFSLNVWPYIFIPYYILLISAGFYHLSYGFACAMRLLVLPWFPALFPLLHKRKVHHEEQKIHTQKVEDTFLWQVGVGLVVLGLISAVFGFAGFYYSIDKTRYPEWERYYEGLGLPDFLLTWQKSSVVA